MDQDELRIFFGQTLKEKGYISSESMAVFGKLIRLTLQYRDRYSEKQGQTLTIDDTRRGLDAYLAVLNSGQFPEDLEPKISGLVILWLKEINGLRY